MLDVHAVHVPHLPVEELGDVRQLEYHANLLEQDLTEAKPTTGYQQHNEGTTQQQHPHQQQQQQLQKHHHQQQQQL